MVVNTIGHLAEAVVQWQPNRNAGPLDGTPRDDPRFAYIKHN